MKYWHKKTKRTLLTEDIPLQILLTPLKFKATLSSKAVNILPILWLFIRLHLPITANDITDPAEIKAYLESQGQEYNENITAIHQITFIDGEATPEGSLCEVEK